MDSVWVECEQCHQWSVPRALCAVSEDRQWLVVVEDSDWRVRKRDGEGRYVPPDEDGGWWVIDTGQDAHAVLASWLEGRE
ncbi:MAG: hypothetical protein E6Q97_19405 [Desulfurellales bacterium]|nr:MAG: hypothetical protein E6Q97_19405 [Desulfurellales bacterium]